MQYSLWQYGAETEYPNRYDITDNVENLVTGCSMPEVFELLVYINKTEHPWYDDPEGNTTLYMEKRYAIKLFDFESLDTLHESHPEYFI